MVPLQLSSSFTSLASGAFIDIIVGGIVVKFGKNMSCATYEQTRTLEQKNGTFIKQCEVYNCTLLAIVYSYSVDTLWINHKEEKQCRKTTIFARLFLNGLKFVLFQLIKIQNGSLSSFSKSWNLWKPLNLNAFTMPCCIISQTKKSLFKKSHIIQFIICRYKFHYTIDL